MYLQHISNTNMLGQGAMKRNTPTRSISFAPEALSLVDAYAEERGIKRSTAVTELLLYVLKGDQCETDPKVIEQAVAMIRDSDGSRRLA